MNLIRAFQELGIDLRAVLREKQPQTQVELGEILVELKAQAKKAFKARALELHPDLHPDDPEKAAEFVRLGEIRDLIMKATNLPFMPPRQQRHPQRRQQIIIIASPTVSPWYSTSASTSVGATYTPTGSTSIFSLWPKW